jgi:two-component system sensor histidine kinase RegB
MATAILADRLLGIDLPLGWIAIPPLLVVFSNLWLGWWHSRSPRPGGFTESTVISWIFVLDTFCLTAVLMLSGGPTNPFSLLYLVHITLAAMILTQRQTWMLGILASACFALLFWRYRPIPRLGMSHHGEGASLHLIGMWVGFMVASCLVTIFSGKISELLRRHEESLLRMQEELAKRDRLAALVTLAAGAAHELSTPLATIAVASKELERYATQTAPNNSIAEDSRLIRTEVDRCREILLRMSAEGAEPAGEAPEAVTIEELLNSVRSTLALKDQLRILAENDVLPVTLMLPKRAVRQALIALIGNACDASTPETAIDVAASRDGDSVRFEVRDSGSGMAPETLGHVGEPFFTTKEPGRGMGLGVFLVRNLAERLGGQLTIESSLGKGTTATLNLPLVSRTIEVTA